MSVARRRFRFIKEIAEGGFGKVYLAEQMSSDGFSRIVAVKLLHAKWSSHDEVVMRTRDEARLLGLIRHHHIVKVEDLTSIDGKCAIVMEYLEGVDLKYMLQFLKDRNLDFPRTALFEILLAAASALDAAYNGRPLQGGDPLKVIHRDIKPSNIFVTVNAGVKVLDFGTARANFAEREAKTQALAFGSQGYMAPERMLGEEDTPAADVFSLGVTLYEMLTNESFGRIPPRPDKFAAKIEEQVASLPLAGNLDWQDQVRDTLRRMLAYEPGDRPTAAELVDLFDVLAQGAGDTPLRRFCRTLVSEAKANEPELDHDDPLAGQTVDEDVSSAFGVSGGIGAGTPPPAPRYGGPPPPPGNLAVASVPGISGPHPRSDAISAPRAIESGSGGGLARILVLLAVLGVFFVLLLVAGGVAVYVLAGGGGEAEPPAVVAAPQGEAAPPPAPTAPAAAAFTGHVLVVPDGRTGVAKARTVLSTSDPAGIEKMKITGLGFDFEVEWDGAGDLDLGPLGEGTYRAIIHPASGSTIRNKSFKVDPGRKKECRFRFDLGAKDWTGECA